MCHGSLDDCADDVPAIVHCEKLIEHRIFVAHCLVAYEKQSFSDFHFVSFRSCEDIAHQIINPNWMTIVTTISSANPTGNVQHQTIFTHRGQWS
jgi:hypothetical protein